MVRKSYTPEQIINKLREVEILLNQGAKIGEACRKIAVTEQTYYRWRREYGGMRIEQAKRLKYLEKENARLKKLVADISLDNAILKEAALKTSGDEYRMRVRVSLRAFWALWEMRYLLSFKKFKLFAWQLWSHKVLRYLCFIFLVGAYFVNLSLWLENDFYKVFFVIQNIAYLGAVMSPVLTKYGRPIKILYFLHYFALLNLASAHAFIKFALGQKQVVWNPRKGI